MQLKHPQQKSFVLILTEKVWQDQTNRFIAILLCGFLVFAVGTQVGQSGFVGKTLIPFVKEQIILLPKKIEATLRTPETKHITIDIRHENFMKLAYQREVALAEQHLVAGGDDFVPATIRYGDESVKVKLRLKGDNVVHLEGDKWSFRIRVKGDNTLMGMKQFSIQHPSMRNYIYEWIYHRALEKEDVLSLRYDFIRVTLNGKDLGIYALEEHFEKRLIEHNQLREGPIIKFNEDLTWTEDFEQRFPFPEAELSGSGSYQSSDIDAFQTNRLLTDPVGNAQFAKAIYLLESFRRGDIAASEAFDVQKYARYLAISDLMGAEHGTVYRNIRYYYNPVTSRLEPIGYDGSSGKFTEILSPRRAGRGKQLFENLFKDAEFFEEYVRTMERMSEPAYLDGLLAELEEELGEKLNIIHSEFPQFDYSEEVFYRNQEYIRTVLNPAKGLHPYYHQATEDQIQLELGNLQTMPIEVLGLSYQGTEIMRPVEPVVLAKKPEPASPVDYQIVSFTIPEDMEWSEAMIEELTVDYKLLGSSQVRQESVFAWSYLDEYFIENDLVREEPNVETFEFLVKDESRKEILIKAGSWTVDRNMIIPAGYRVIARGNTELDLSNSARILSYSALEFIGNEEGPIKIESTDGSGQGLVVMNTGETSILEQVTFNNLANPAQRGWELTGAVNFYEAPVHISQVEFVGNRSEDGLNIIRSEFTIDESLFSETMSDAFDADFANGQITNSSFVAIGNDAIDISGSVVEVRDVTINGAGDKGLSTGENSQMTARDVEITDAAIAIASKDISTMMLSNVKISGGEIGLAAYQKKPEFGAASITADELEMDGVGLPYLVENRSTVIVDQQLIEASRDNVEDILYGVEYGKSSK